MANTSFLFPILEPYSPRVSSLARAAAEAPLHSSGCRTDYRPLTSRTIISKTTSGRGLPFSHTINPYRGCEFACRYCYARYTHEFMNQTPDAFEHNIYFKQNAPWLLRQELARLKRGTEIALGTATDPYQPLERHMRLTRSMLEVFAATSGFSLGIVTKSTLITRDIDLLEQVAARHKLTLHLTITTMDVRLARLLEPRAPRPDLRIATLRQLREAGLRAGVLCSPLMPGVTDARSSINAVAKAAAAAGARFFAAGALFLKPCSLPTFFQFLEEHFPQLLPAYKRRYSENAFVSPEYRKRIAEVVDAVCHEHRLGHRDGDLVEEEEIVRAERVELQPWLPFAGQSQSAQTVTGRARLRDWSPARQPGGTRRRLSGS